MKNDLTPRQQRIVLLDNLNMTQTEAAAKLGISRVHFNRLFNQDGFHRHFDLRLQGLVRSQRIKAERKSES